MPVEGALTKKLVSICFTVVGLEDQWQMLEENLVAARLWVKSCERMEGSSALKREAVDFVMEIKISDGVGASTTRTVTAPVRREEDDGIDGEYRVAGQSAEMQLSRFQNLNSLS